MSPMIQYFYGINTLPELKKEYYKLAILHHPDKGGDTDTMAEINAEYELLQSRISNGEAVGSFIEEVEQFFNSREGRLFLKIFSVLLLAWALKNLLKRE